MRLILALALVATATARIDGVIPTGTSATGITATGKDDCEAVCREFGKEHVECLACQKGMKTKMYCKKKPETCGCSDGICGVPTGTDGGGGGESCCEAMTLDCMVCACENDGMIAGMPAKDCSQHNICQMATEMMFMCIPGCKCEPDVGGGDGDYLQEGDECVPGDLVNGGIRPGGINPRRRLKLDGVTATGTKGGFGTQPSGGFDIDTLPMFGKCAPGLKCMASRDFVIGTDAVSGSHKIFTCQYGNGGNSGGDECDGDRGCMCDMKCSMHPDAGTDADDGSCFDDCMGNTGGNGGGEQCKDEDWPCKCKRRCMGNATTHADMQDDSCYKECMTNTPSPNGDGDMCRRGQTEDMCWSIAGCMWWMPMIEVGGDCDSYPPGVPCPIGRRLQDIVSATGTATKPGSFQPTTVGTGGKTGGKGGATGVGGNGGAVTINDGKCVPDDMNHGSGSGMGGGGDCTKKCMEIGGMDSKKIYECLTEQCGLDVEWGDVECTVEKCFARAGVSNLATLVGGVGGLGDAMDMMMKMGKCACDECGFCPNGDSNGSGHDSDPLGRCHDKCAMMMDNFHQMTTDADLVNDRDMEDKMNGMNDEMDKCFRKCDNEHGNGHVDPDGECLQKCDHIYNEAMEGCGEWCDGEELDDGTWDDSMCWDTNDAVDRCYNQANKRYSQCMCNECNDEWMCQEHTMDQCHSDCEVHNQDINWADMTEDEAHEAGMRFDDCMCKCDNKMNQMQGSMNKGGWHYDQCEVDRCFNKCWKMDGNNMDGRAPPIRRRLQKQPGTNTVNSDDIKNGGVFKPNNGGGNVGTVGGIGGQDVGADPQKCHMGCDRMWEDFGEAGDVSQGAMHTTIENCHQRCDGVEPNMRDNCDPQQEDCHVKQGGNGSGHGNGIDTPVDPIDVNDGNKRCMKECMKEKIGDTEEATKKHCMQRCGDGTDMPVDPIDVNDGNDMCMKECMKNQKNDFIDQHPTDSGDANQARFKKFCMQQCGDGTDPNHGTGSGCTGAMCGQHGTGSGHQGSSGSMTDDWWKGEQQRYRCENECQLMMEPPQCRHCMQKDNERMVEEMDPKYWDRWEAMDHTQQCIHDMEKDLAWMETDKCMCECGNANWCGEWTDQDWEGRENDTRQTWDCENASGSNSGSGGHGSTGCGPACPNGEDLWCENWAHDDAGCPMCMCEEEPMGCTWEGTSYEEGDMWDVDCNSCWCEHGAAMCTEKACHHECDNVDCADAWAECDNSRYIPPNYDEGKCCGEYDNSDCPKCEPMTDGACACEEGQLEIWFDDATTKCNTCYCEQIDFGSGGGSGGSGGDQDACAIGADYIKDKKLKKTLKKVNKKIKKFCKLVKKCTKAGDGPETCKKAKAGGVDRQIKDIQAMAASVDCEDSVNFGKSFKFPSMDKLPCAKKIMSAWEKAGESSGGGDGGGDDKCAGLAKKKCNKKDGCTFDGSDCVSE